MFFSRSSSRLKIDALGRLVADGYGLAELPEHIFR
jgi:hypothetical protein